MASFRSSSKARGHDPDRRPFFPESLERGVRSEQALRLALAEMYVQGVLTRKVREITEKLCGTQISSSEVSRVAAQLDEQLEAWRTRKLGQVRYLGLDATYLKVRLGGSVVDCDVLVTAGVRGDGKRSVLVCSVSLSEAEVHWPAFLEELAERGLHGVAQITSDDHAGLRAAIRAVLPSTPWQRCQVHLQRNAVAFVPKVEMRSQVARNIRAVFQAPSRPEADRLRQQAIKKYAKAAPRLFVWLESSAPEGLKVFALPEAHRRRLRTSNLLELLAP